MNDFASFLNARDRTSEEAQSALPNSPIRPDEPRRGLRLRISAAIFRLADRIDPTPVSTRPGAPTMAGSGH